MGLAGAERDAVIAVQSVSSHVLTRTWRCLSNIVCIEVRNWLTILTVLDIGQSLETRRVECRKGLSFGDVHCHRGRLRRLKCSVLEKRVDRRGSTEETVRVSEVFTA